MFPILLTHSYYLRFDPKEWRSAMPYPPLGTLYATAVLRARGHDVAIHDTMFRKSEEEISASISRHHAAVVVIYDDGFNSLTKMCLSRMRDAALRMTRIARSRGCTVIIHSSDATDHLESYFAAGANYVACGEAEFTVAELCDALRNGEHAVDGIAGLAFVRDGRIVRTEPRRPVEQLDEIPFPAWDCIDLSPYRHMWQHHHRRFSVNMVTTRGCPFHCNWCAKPLYGQIYHSRSPGNVVEEMSLLQATVQPDHLWFSDDIFGLTPGWIAAFVEALEARHVRIPFKCLSRADLLLQRETIPLLARAGCETVWLGAESGSQTILDAMDKGTTVAQIREAARRLHAAGIRVGFFIQFGYPGERIDEIRATFELVRMCAPDEIGVSVSYPLPGTVFYERMRQAMGLKQNWVDSNDLDLLFPGEYVPAFYRLLHRSLHKQFSVWRAMRELSDGPRALRVRRARIVRDLAGAAFHYATLPLVRRKLSALSGDPGFQSL